MSNNELVIQDLIDNYPDVSWPEVSREVLVELAERYLRAERAKQWDVRGYVPDAGRAAVATLNESAVKRAHRRRVANSERAVLERAKFDAAVSNSISSIVRKTADRIASEWLPSLLEETFSLPDGTLVSWGSATAEQHETRARWLESVASTNVETAAIHRKASADIRRSGMSSLDRAVTRAA